MNQRKDKPVSEFTDKQRKAFRAVMRKISQSSDYRRSKIVLVSAIRESGAYSRKHDAIKALKMLIMNSNTPLSLKNGDVTRNDIQKTDRGRETA